MGDVAIKVEGFLKRHRIGLEDEEHGALVGALSSWMEPTSGYAEDSRARLEPPGSGHSRQFIIADKR